MERQIPRSIQYSDLRPEVIENQVKLVRFTPQTNIQNQVPNDIVRFQLQGNGFYDPYSAYISMTVDFGEPEDQFTIAAPFAPVGTGLFDMQQMWINVFKATSENKFGEIYRSEPLTQGNETFKIGCTLSDLELDHQNMIVRKSKDGTYDRSLVDGAITLTNYAQVTDQLTHHAQDYSNPAGVFTSFTQHVFDHTLSMLGQIGCSSITTTVPVNDNTFISASTQADATKLTKLAGPIKAYDGVLKGDGTQKHIPIPGAEFKILDRSAHSFINRLVIRSQGTEIERIEQYDVVAGMLNDMIYSNEQAQFHSFEGFGGTPLTQQMPSNGFVNLQRSVVANSVMGPRGRCGERIWGWAFVSVDENNWLTQCSTSVDLTYDLDTVNANGQLTQGSMQLTAPGNQLGRIMSTGVFNVEMYRYNLADNHYSQAQELQINALEDYALTQSLNRNIDQYSPWTMSFSAITGRTESQANAMAKKIMPTQSNTQVNLWYNPYKPNFLDSLFCGLKNHPIRWFLQKTQHACKTPGEYLRFIAGNALSSDYIDLYRPGQYRMTRLGQQQYEFAIPIYSGLIGVLMPEKKLLPLSLMPLEVDFTLNPHALIACHSQGYGQKLSRFYTVKRMEIYSHMVFFEQDVHRSMESIVAENGLFIHINTFYMAPVTVHPLESVIQNIPINLHFKNINSIHLINLYSNYLTRPSVRKLNFVSHNVTSIQIRNGTDLIPSEPLRSENIFQFQYTNQTVSGGRCSRLFIELLKAYNKMHDPMCDVALDPGLVFLSDCYADASSINATDFDNGNDLSFSNETVPRSSVICTKIIQMINRSSLTGADTPAGTLFTTQSWAGYILNTTNFAAAQQEIADSAGCGGVPRVSTMRGLVRLMRMSSLLTNEKTTDLINIKSGIHPQGSWGSNPNHIGKRPTIFFAPKQGGITSQNVEDLNYWGISAGLLKDKIQRFTALTGRCQIAMSLEGINLGVDNSLLCGKRGMIPFDILFTGTKNDKATSISLVFAKCDFIVYIRPDLVVTVLGK